MQSAPLHTETSSSPRLVASTLIALAFAGCATTGDDQGTDAGPDATAATVDAAATDAAGQDASPVDAAPPPDAMCTSGWVELLASGDFDGVNTAWTQTSNGGNVIRTSQAPWPPHSGATWSLFLGFNNAVQTLRQTVTVPPSASDLRLSGYRCWVTAESPTPYDHVDIELRDAGGNLLETLWARDNTHAGASCAWLEFQLVATQAYAGQTIDLVFSATSDGATATSFGFDTLSLQAYACM